MVCSPQHFGWPSKGVWDEGVYKGVNIFLRTSSIPLFFVNLSTCPQFWEGVNPFHSKTGFSPVFLDHVTRFVGGITG